MFKRLDNNIIFSLWDNGLSISEIQEKTGYSNTSIREHLQEYSNFSINESIQRGILKAAKSHSIPVIQWDLEGNFIQKYDNAVAAEKETSVPAQNIHKCLIKERQTAGQFYWTHEGEMPIIKKKIYQYDKNNNLIKIFNTKAEAAKELNLDSGSITKVCKGQRKTCGGFIWKEM